MNNDHAIDKIFGLVGNIHWFSIVGLWSLLIYGLCTHAILQFKDGITENALLEAKTNIDKDLAYRRWASEQGGIYIAPTEKTPPNPYLQDPHRDVVTTAGMPLTLVNPAYMTRLVHESASQLYGVRGHLTSLNPIRPENKADAWEEAALKEIEQGVDEVTIPAFAIEGKIYLRQIRKFVTESPCLKCHAAQGYAVGDVRGGISVSVPLDRYYAIYRAERNGALLSYSLIWCIGLGGIIAFRNNLRRNTASLQASERRFRMLIEQAPEGIVVFDADKGQIVDVNSAAERLFACSRRELLQGDLERFYTQDQPDGRPVEVSKRENIQRVLSGEVVQVERTITSADANFFWCELHLALLPSEQEKLIRGIFIDITERKKAEQALKESEERLQLVMEGSQLGYWDWNIETGEVRRNKHWAEMLGYTLQEIEDNVQQWTDLHHPDDRAAAWQSIQDHLAGKTPNHRIEYRMLAKNGQYRWILDQARVVKWSEQGKPTRMSGTHTDVTERKHAEEQLVHKDALLRAMLRNLPFDFWARDLEQRIIMQSDESIRSWGDLYGRAPSATPLDDEIINHWQKNNCEVLAGKIVSEDCSYVDIHGEKREYHGIVAPIREGETILGILGINIDITQRKLAEKANLTLQAQLTQSQKMEAIGTLAGGIAHDFNNILGAILGYAEMAKEASPVDSDIAHDLEKVLASAERAADLVKQILAFSHQSTADRLSLEPVHLVKETIKLLRPALPVTIEIQQNLEAVTRNILADPTQIHQVVMNLCTNAFHAMEDTGGILEITLHECDLSAQDLQHQPTVQPGSFVMLSIRDTGPGIPQDIQNRIFEPYFTTKEVGKGTGLGLSIVHGIVTSLGGFVTCESERGNGTTFRVFIPAIEAETIAAPKHEDSKLSGKEHILLIDDEEMLISMGKAMLERLGYRVTTRSSSLDALATFQNQPQEFDAVVTDQTMPGMTGVDLARRMLQIRPSIPIILCTGYSTIINEEQALRVGIKGFAMKPLSKKDLAAALRKALDQGKFIQ